jgi:hypothetical protein
MQQCVRCLLPRTVPGADLDAFGVCRACREFQEGNHQRKEQLRRDREADLEKALRDCRGQGEYDCLVNLSGGKDSCYLLYKLKQEYGLHVLAFTTDMNVPPVAWANIRRTVDRLGVDHVVYRPPEEFYRKLFRFLLQNQEARGAVRTVCYVCAPLFECYALRVAVEKNIPLVVAGYSPGQPEPERMEYEFAREMIAATDWTPPEVRASGLFSEEELARFWNPFRYPPQTRFPRYLAPFHAWPYSQAETMRKVVELGLISDSKSANPIHSNCPVNWLLMYSDLQNLGYNPYAPEFSALIREGKASRRYWRILIPIVNAMIRYKVFLGRNVKRSMKWLGLKPADLRITRPAPDEKGRLPLPMLSSHPDNSTPLSPLHR